MYAITAQVMNESHGWTSSRQVPTFYLHESVQGIVDESHAQKIALDILGAALDLENAGSDVQILVSAVKV